MLVVIWNYVSWFKMRQRFRYNSYGEFSVLSSLLQPWTEEGGGARKPKASSALTPDARGGQAHVWALKWMLSRWALCSKRKAVPFWNHSLCVNRSSLRISQRSSSPVFVQSAVHCSREICLPPFQNNLCCLVPQKYLVGYILELVTGSSIGPTMEQQCSIALVRCFLTCTVHESELFAQAL